jgi:hypothetical protein
MRWFRRRHLRVVKRLAQALVALDDEAALVRPAPPKLLRSHLGPFAT